jgi:NTE family protein
MYLVIGPAAMGIYSFIGSLKVLDLNKIKEVSGSSAGAILGLFICSGKTIEEILEFCLHVDLKELTKMNLTSLITGFGLISHTPIKKVLREFCGDLKFRDLSKKLHVTSFCVNKSTTEYFSVDTSPDMSVIDAVCMSMTVPFLFETIKHNNFTYLDGGTCEIVPTMSFINKDPSEVVVLRLQINKVCIPEIKSIRDFIGGLIQLAVNNRTMEKTCYKEICIDLGTMNIFDFLMDLEGKLKLYLLGHQTTLTQLGLDK